MRFIVVILFMILVFLVLAAFLCAGAIGIGSLLAICLDSLQLGHGIITGAVVSTGALYIFLWVLNTSNPSNDYDEDDSEPAPIFVVPRDFSPYRSQKTKSQKKKK